MIEAGIAALENSTLAEALRASRYAYPLVNAAHILALASLFGAILALDLRLLGLFAGVAASPLAKTLPRVAGFGLVLAVLTGGALFSVQPFDYLGHPAFPIKLGLIAAALANLAMLHRSRAWRELLEGGDRVPPPVRFSAGFSLLAWTGAILCGRFLAF